MKPGSGVGGPALRAIPRTNSRMRKEDKARAADPRLYVSVPIVPPLGKPAPTTARSQIGIKPRTGRIVVIPDTRVKRAGGRRVVAHLRQAQRGRGADELRALGRSL